MIQLTPHMKIFVAVKPVDFRAGIDGLARLCKTVCRADPFSGAVFVFRNKRARAVKVLVYDGQGFWLMHKRLSQGRYVHWPSGGEATISLESHQLQVLLAGGDGVRASGTEAWRRLAA